MDTSRERHEFEATGWQRGLYDDVKYTFRAPIVNWIFRTTMANEPDFLRYAWGQVKPVFQTRAFARVTVAYRDAILSTLSVPTYRRSELGIGPAEYRELHDQIATYDVVAPRLAVWFEIMDRGLHGELQSEVADARATTAPFPSDLDRERGRSPTLLDEVPPELQPTADRIRAFHGLDEQLPSIYRTLAQWPPYLERAWTDLEPVFEDRSFAEARMNAEGHVESFVEQLPYNPRLSPATLEGLFDEETIQDVRSTFREFNTGAVETVLPVLPVFAATMGAEGARSIG